MSAWKVKVSAKCERELIDLLDRGLIGRDEQIIIRDWVRFVQKYGPYKLNDYSFFNFKDHELTKDPKWKNHRSSAFSYSGRIIYKIKDNIVTVEVVRITTDHDYR